MIINFFGAYEETTKEGKKITERFSLQQLFCLLRMIEITTFENIFIYLFPPKLNVLMHTSFESSKGKLTLQLLYDP